MIDTEHGYDDPARVQERIKEIAGSLFELEAAELSMSSGPEEVPGWDSLTHLRLATELEAAFSHRFTMEQIQQAQSLGDFAGYLAQ